MSASSTSRSRPTITPAPSRTSRGQSDHPQTQRAERRRIAGAGVPENNDDQNQIDRQQHRVLHAEKQKSRPRRQVVYRVKQIFRSGHVDAFILMRSSVTKNFSSTLRGLLVQSDSLEETPRTRHPRKQRALPHETAS